MPSLINGNVYSLLSREELHSVQDSNWGVSSVVIKFKLVV